jgi:hypothetical protein
MVKDPLSLNGPTQKEPEQIHIEDIKTRPYLYDGEYIKQPFAMMNIIRRGEQYYFKINNMGPLNELIFSPYYGESNALIHTNSRGMIAYKLSPS